MPSLDHEALAAELLRDADLSQAALTAPAAVSTINTAPAAIGAPRETSESQRSVHISAALPSAAPTWVLRSNSSRILPRPVGSKNAAMLAHHRILTSQGSR